MFARLAVAVAVALSFARTVDPKAESRDLDFGALYRGAQAVARGDSPYVNDRYGPLGAYIYSPAWAYVLRPLAWFDYTSARRIWMTVNWLLAAGCVAMALRLAFGRVSVPALALWLTVLPVASYFWSTLRAGQFSLVMAALYMGWALCRRIGWRFTGGALLAASVAVKLAPGILVPYLLVRRDWRGLAGVAAGGLTLALMPAYWVGVDDAVLQHLEWYAHCRDTQVVVQALRPENQSLLGHLTRLPHISNGYALFDVPAFDAIYRAYPLIVLAMIAGIYGTLAWRRCRFKTLPDDEAEIREISILILAMLLLHPRAWTYNFVGLALPCAMLARHIVTGTERRWLALAGLVLMAAVCVMPKPSVASDWTFLRWLHQGKDCWAALVVVTIGAWPQRRQPEIVCRADPEFSQAA